MMRAVIIEDEWLARAELRRLLTAHPEVDVVAEATNIEEARALIAETDPDLLFLDIEMPGGTGFDLLASLVRVPAVIFTTAFDEHALRAFEVNALDYVVKPIHPDRLARALARAEAVVTPRAPESVLSKGDRVFVQDGERCWFVPVEEITLIEAVEGYARVHFSGEKPLLNRSLNQLEARLDSDLFFRANKSQLINLKAVRSVDPWLKRRLRVVLDGGSEVILSRRRAADFRERLGM